MKSNMIQTIQLTKQFDGLTAVDGIDICAKKREISLTSRTKWSRKDNDYTHAESDSEPTSGDAFVGGCSIIDEADWEGK